MGREEKLRLWMGVCCLATGLAPAIRGQGALGTLLQIDAKDHTLYVYDADHSQWAKTPGKLTRASPAGTFDTWLGIGDITAVNGNPAAGTILESGLSVFTRPNPVPGQAIADVTRGGLYQWNLDLLTPDGRSIGSIYIGGFSQGLPPPGAPSAIDHAAFIVTGGTGAFAGVRGYFNNNGDPNVAPIRTTSVAEDPAYRRVNGGGVIHAILYLIPSTWPEIVTLNGAPLVYHSDFTPVTTDGPAAAGEVLIARVRGMGPTRPSVDPGRTFPNPPVPVNSPVGVTVNGHDAEVINAIGWPGTTDEYRVDFRIPGGLASGTAGIQISAAWIVGVPSSIPVR